MDTSAPASPTVLPGVSLTPEQPPEVVRAVAEALRHDPGTADPWWRAGIDESLEP